MRKITSLILLTLFTLLSVNTSEAVEITVLGPVKYVRTSEGSNTFSDTFRAIPKQGMLHVRNGDGVGEDQISSGWVRINGMEIFTPDDFNQKVLSLESPVDLLDENSIHIEVSSKPGSYLEIWVTVDVPLPTADLAVDPASIPLGESAELSWTTEHADSCTIEPEPESGEVDLNSSATVSPAETVTYTITCTNLGGSVTDQVTLEVYDPEPSVSISAAPQTIALGTSTLLSWQSSNVDKVHIDNKIGAVEATNSLSVTPEHTTTYTITGSGAEGTVSAQVTVQVQGSPAPPPCCPGRAAMSTRSISTTRSVRSRQRI
ncbi:MAG: hypothetical protein D3910_25770, partial [Candidatus Electrothrix sp. ATG2]|nr:hypothetical protein [Candidatus Electrothrix sp. ATG2]